MMKKEYLTPEMIVRNICIEGIMQSQSVVIDKNLEDPTPEGGWGLDNAESKSGNDNSFNVWED